MLVLLARAHLFPVFRLMTRLVIPALAIIGHRAAAAPDAPPAPRMYISIRDAFLGTNVFPSPVEGLKRLGIDAIELNLKRDFSVQGLDS